MSHDLVVSTTPTIHHAECVKANTDVDEAIAPAVGVIRLASEILKPHLRVRPIQLLIVVFVAGTAKMAEQSQGEGSGFQPGKGDRRMIKPSLVERIQLVRYSRVDGSIIQD